MIRAFDRVLVGLLGGIAVVAFGLIYLGGYPGAYVLMVLTALVAVTMLMARHRIWIPNEPATMLLLAAFVLLGLAFISTARNGTEPFYVLNFTMFVLFAPLSAAFARFARPGATATLATIALLGSALATATALLQVLVLREHRAIAWASDPIWSAQAALILGFLAFCGFLVVRDNRRWLYLIGPVLGVSTTLLSGSRGPLLAAPVLFVIALLFGFRRWWLGLTGGAAVAAVLVAGVYVASPKTFHRIQSIPTVLSEALLDRGKVEEYSAGARMVFWTIGGRAMADSPIVGHGWDKRIASAYKYLPDKGKAFEARGSQLAGNHHLHADILDLGVAAGALGLLAYGLLLAAPIAGALNGPEDSQRRARVMAGLMLSAGYFVCGLSYLMFGYEYHTSLFVCLLAALTGWCRDTP